MSWYVAVVGFHVTLVDALSAEDFAEDFESTGTQ